MVETQLHTSASLYLVFSLYTSPHNLCETENHT